MFHQKLAAASASFTLRVSCRYLHPKFDLLERLYLRGEGIPAKSLQWAEGRAGYVTARPPVVPLKSFCARPIMRGVQPVYEDESEVAAIKTANLKNGYIELADVETVSEDFYAKVQRRAGIRRGDVLISTTGVGSLGKVGFYDLDKPAVADGHVAIVRITKDEIRPHLLANLLRSRLVQWQIERQLSGATNQIEIYNDQIAGLRLPVLSAERQQSLFTQITDIESSIGAARARLRQPAEIINGVLCPAFGYTPPDEGAQHQPHVRSLSAFARGFTLRNSARFHRPAFEQLDAFFARTPHKPVKALLSIPIRLGATLPRAALDEDGEALYVHPGALRRQMLIEADECHRIKREFYDLNKARSSLRMGDVMINRSGEATIGKSGVYNWMNWLCLRTSQCDFDLTKV